MRIIRPIRATQTVKIIGLVRLLVQSLKLRHLHCGAYLEYVESMRIYFQLRYFFGQNSRFHTEQRGYYGE